MSDSARTFLQNGRPCLLQGIFRTKSLNAILASAEAPESQLRRSLGVVQLTLLGIGAIIGAGIFVLTGTAAALYAGPALTISFVLAAIACGLVGLCYAELSIGLVIYFVYGRLQSRLRAR
jgi:amino acid permease